MRRRGGALGPSFETVVIHIKWSNKTLGDLQDTVEMFEARIKPRIKEPYEAYITMTGNAEDGTINAFLKALTDCEIIETKRSEVIRMGPKEEQFEEAVENVLVQPVN